LTLTAPRPIGPKLAGSAATARDGTLRQIIFVRAMRGPRSGTTVKVVSGLDADRNL